MILVNGLGGRRIMAGAIAGLFLLSSSTFAASRVSAPPRPYAGKQIVRPGETAEQMKQSARAHSNKLRNKVTPERALSPSVEDSRPASQASSISQQESKLDVDLASAQFLRQQD